MLSSVWERILWVYRPAIYYGYQIRLECRTDYVLNREYLYNMRTMKFEILSRFVLLIKSDVV